MVGVGDSVTQKRARMARLMLYGFVVFGEIKMWLRAIRLNIYCVAWREKVIWRSFVREKFVRIAALTL